MTANEWLGVMKQAQDFPKGMEKLIVKYGEMNSNKPQRPQLNIGAVMCSFSPVADSKATKALQFYEDCADNLPYYQTSEKDNGFDWNRCRAYCSVGKSYSHQRFMAYVAEWFGTTVKEMKLQWRK